MRIVSCVPSISELAEELCPGSLVGRTRFCIAPASIANVPKIGGTKDLNTDAIIALNPDIVLSVKEENEKEQIEILEKAGIRTEVFDIRNLEDAIQMVKTMGNIFDNKNKAIEIVEGMNEVIDGKKKGSILYFIWQKPFMCAGPDTFIGDVLHRCGFRNIAPTGPASDRYPVLTVSEIDHLKPDFIFLSSEPFPFKEIHREFFANNFPFAQVHLVDGSLFSWYGSRTRRIPSALKEMNLRPFIQ